MAEDIAVGVIYERQGAPHIRWVVETVTRIDDIPHVYLQRIGDPTDVRLLSETALANRREFRRVAVDVSTDWWLEWCALCPDRFRWGAPKAFVSSKSWRVS
nr:uncharacterized protein [uncultured bacterium]